MGRLAAIAKLGVNRLEERLQEQPPLALVPPPDHRPHRIQSHRAPPVRKPARRPQ